MKCKNCNREIMQGVNQGKSYWYHCIDFGDCDAEPEFEQEDEIPDFKDESSFLSELDYNLLLDLLEGAKVEDFILVYKKKGKKISQAFNCSQQFRNEVFDILTSLNK